MANHKKHDYSGDEFYTLIETYAKQGLNDMEIADSLDLAPEVFYAMKGGKYRGWTQTENKLFSARILETLAKGRRKVLGIVRGRYLKAALGGIKTKTVVKKFVTEKCPCGGDPECADCAGEGWIVSTTKAIVQESEVELPPNMQALSLWLYHHDADWRAIERKQDESTSDIPTDVPQGVDIDAWIRKETKADD